MIVWVQFTEGLGRNEKIALCRRILNTEKNICAGSERMKRKN